MDQSCHFWPKMAPFRRCSSYLNSPQFLQGRPGGGALREVSPRTREGRRPDHPKARSDLHLRSPHSGSQMPVADETPAAPGRNSSARSRIDYGCVVTISECTRRWLSVPGSLMRPLPSGRQCRWLRPKAASVSYTPVAANTPPGSGPTPTASQNCDSCPTPGFWPRHSVR